MEIWKRIRAPFIVVAVGIVIIGIISTSKPKPQPHLDNEGERAKVEVKVQRATPSTTTLSVSTQGTVAPKREINIVAQVSGQVQIVEPEFVDGGVFEANQLLIQIEDRDYRAAYLAAKARLASAEQLAAEERGRARQAKREWRDLGNSDANDLFLRKPQIKAAEAAVDSASADVARAKLDLERTQIRVPFNGRIRETFVDLGQYVTPGTPIAQVYDSSVVEIKLPLTDRQVGLVNLPLGYVAQDKNTATQDKSSAPKATIYGVIGGEEYEWPARITRTAASIDTQSRMMFAVAEVETPTEADVPLVVGLFVTAKIEGKELENVVTLPRDAVFKRNRMFVLDDAHAISEVETKVLYRNSDYVWVKSSVPSDSLIVLEKQALLSPGTQVDALLDGKIVTPKKKASNDESIAATPEAKAKATTVTSGE